MNEVCKNRRGEDMLPEYDLSKGVRGSMLQQFSIACVLGVYVCRGDPCDRPIYIGRQQQGEYKIRPYEREEDSFE